LSGTYLPLGSIDFTNLGSGAVHDYRADSINSNDDIPFSSYIPALQATGTTLLNALDHMVPESVSSNPAYQSNLNEFRDAIDRAGSSYHLSFPIIENPADAALKLFMGWDASFVNFSIDLNSFRFARNAGLSIPSATSFVASSVPVQFYGDMTMDVHLTMGFD